MSVIDVGDFLDLVWILLYVRGYRFGRNRVNVIIVERFLLGVGFV